MTTLEQIKAEFADFNERRKVLVEKLRIEFGTMFGPLFEKSDKIESMGWTQYTPYFNDGDSCTFRVNEPDQINGEYDSNIEWYDWKVNYYLKEDRYKTDIEENSAIDINACDAFLEFRELIESIQDDILKDLFGDHALVTVKRDGTVEVEEYEHD